MTKVNPGTRKAQELIHDMFHTYYKGRRLEDCYSSCSSAKWRAWHDIENQCYELNGEDLHITGAGSHFFSCIYAYPITDKETGEVTDMVIRKETASNTYELKLPVSDYIKVKLQTAIF